MARSGHPIGSDCPRLRGEGPAAWLTGEQVFGDGGVGDQCLEVAAGEGGAGLKFKRGRF